MAPDLLSTLLGWLETLAPAFTKPCGRSMVDAQLYHPAHERMSGDAEQLGRANDVPGELEGRYAQAALGRFEVEVFEDELRRGAVHGWDTYYPTDLFSRGSGVANAWARPGP